MSEEIPHHPAQPPENQNLVTSVRSLRELVEMVSGHRSSGTVPDAGDATQEDSGLAEVLPFPFLALVGQEEMKIALLLNIINPHVGGVLLVGPRGTGKTTAARSLIDLLPEIQRSGCFYGCMPEDIEIGGMDAVCPDCARKYAEGQSLVVRERVHLIELPLNAKLEDVIGGLDERAALHQRLRLKRGILAQADQNILYIDEVNLLADEIVDAILDAAAQNSYTIRRGPVSATYKSRFTLIGSMNPEEGRLRPQITDRFGLRINVRGLEEPQERLEAYRRVLAYQTSPRRTIADYAVDTDMARTEIEEARHLLPQVQVPDAIAQNSIALIQQLKIDSLRAEITLFEAARAYAAAAGRTRVNWEDICIVAPMALRMRRSQFMIDYFREQSAEEQEFSTVLASFNIVPPTSPQENKT